MDATLTPRAVQEYWEQRAAASPHPNATTEDIWLREMELATLAEALASARLPPDACLLDAGCGDGYTTLRLAERFPGWRFTGVDFASAMVANARTNLSSRPQLASHVTFRAGDIRKLPEAVDGRAFDAVLSVRCLINLETLDAQAAAISNIAACLRPGGLYLAIENFLEGHDAMNAARARIGLDPISVRWHNRYFTEAEFRQAAWPWFSDVRMHDFSSSYYLATRVLYSAWCRETGRPIDYNHALHRLATQLPHCGGFSPVRLVVLRKGG